MHVKQALENNGYQVEQNAKKTMGDGGRKNGTADGFHQQMLATNERSVASLDDVVYHVAEYAGEPHVETLAPNREPLVIDAQ